MNDFREMVRADLTAPLNATMKRRRPKPKGMLQRAAIAAAHVDVDEVDVDEVDVDEVDVDEVDVDEVDVASEIRDALTKLEPEAQRQAWTQSNRSN